jgi:hypothetical protein
MNRNRARDYGKGFARVSGTYLARGAGDLAKTIYNLREHLWSRLGSNQCPSACELEVIAGQARTCWSDRTSWTSKRLLSQWFRD